MGVVNVSTVVGNIVTQTVSEKKKKTCWEQLTLFLEGSPQILFTQSSHLAFWNGMLVSQTFYLTDCRRGHLWSTCLWFSLLDHVGRFERGMVSASNTCDHSVCCDCAQQPHQDNLLLSGQQVAVTPVCSWHWECPHDASLAAAVVLTVPKCCFSSCYGSCCWELSFFYLSRVYLLSRLDLLEVIFIPCSLSYRVSLHVISKLPTLDKTSVKQTLILSETFEFQV